MYLWISRVVFAIAILGLWTSTTTQSLAKNGQGRNNATVVNAAAGVDKAGEPVVLRPSGPVPGQFIVVFQDNVTNPRGLANALARQNDIALRGVYSTALKGFAARMPNAVAERLSLDPNVAYVEQDIYVQADFHGELVTGVERINAEQNLAFQAGTVVVDVAVIDTGIHPHSDLTLAPDFYDCRGGCVKAGAFDDNGHGTHVAGTIGSMDNDVITTVGAIDYEVVGVAPGARLWGFKVLDSNGSGFISDVVFAVDKVTELGFIKVTNMSLSAQGYVASFRTAIQNSVNTGVVHVVAAGNAQMDVYGPDGAIAQSVTFGCLLLGRGCPDDIIPASYPEAMAVSAMGDFDGVAGGFTDKTVTFNSCTHTEDDVFACFTNYSQSVASGNPVTSPGAAIDVAGPGVSILSTWNNGGYAIISGTSMASPHVAGAVALCIAEDCTGLGGLPASASDVAGIRQSIIDGAQPQAAWGPADTKDPDSNAEGLVYVGGPVGPVTDLAITSVVAPPLALVGAPYNVSVNVANNGTEAASAMVSLDDIPGATISADQNVSLAPGQGTTLDFSWTPSTTGAHMLTASHTLLDDNGANDSATTEISVSAPVTDAAVTSIAAPSPVEVNTAQTVTVGVTNNSTQQETVTVSLNDTLGAAIGPDQSVPLGAGASTTLNFSWTPTASGDHDLTATATLTGDEDSTNDSESIVSSVTEPGSALFVVESICYAGQGGRLRNKQLISTILITDGTTPVAGVTVAATVTDTANNSRSGTGTTDSAGEVRFSWKNADLGEIYTTNVDSVNGDTDIATPVNAVLWDAGNGSCF